MKLRTISGVTYTLDNALARMKDFVQSQPDYEYEIYVGTDSQRRRKSRNVLYTTVLAIYRVGKDVQFYYINEEVRYGYAIDVSVKLLKEVTDSLAILQEIEGSDVYEMVGRDNVTVDIDVNPNPKFKSNKVLDQCKGLVLGYGYKYRIKPNAIFSSSVADRFTKLKV